MRERQWEGGRSERERDSGLVTDRVVRRCYHSLYTTHKHNANYTGLVFSVLLGLLAILMKIQCQAHHRDIRDPDSISWVDILNPYIFLHAWSPC